LPPRDATSIDDLRQQRDLESEQSAPAAVATDEVSASLFDEMPRQFEFGGRWSSVEGDPARWQRYQDLRAVHS
jgi:hypothetical protein